MLQKRWISLLAVCVVLFLLGGCGKKESVTELKMQELSKDTTWEGTVIVHGDIYVPPGVTLTVKPGTTVKFKRIDEKSDQNLFGIDSPYYPEAELIVRGKLIAEGTPEKIIVFTSAEIDTRPKDWGAINFLGSEGNRMSYCKILFAYNGVHGHGSEAVISHSEFAKNGVGVSFKMEEETPGVPWFGKTSTMTITDSKFLNNKGGIGFRNAQGRIEGNIIEDNKFFGIFPKENSAILVRHNDIIGNKKGVYLYQAQSVKIEENNITDNTDYDVAVAEAQDYDVDARNNWFGTINKVKIEERIFDKNDDADLGRVLYEPFKNERVNWD